MLRVKTIAAGITNLSDARYFASYGVDWMTFPSSRHKDNLGQIKELIEWCEGPQFALELDEEDAAFAHFAVQELDIHGVVVDHDWWADSGIAQILWATKENLREVQWGRWQAVVIDPKSLHKVPADFTSKTFLDSLGVSGEEMRTLIKDYPNLGWVVYGSGEERVGYKDFDQQAEVIDLLIE